MHRASSTRGNPFPRHRRERTFARRFRAPLAWLSVVSMTVVTLTLPPMAGAAGGGPSAESRPWKGAETFSPVTLSPNPARCGASPPNVFAVFSGSGVDTAGGVFQVQASGCMNLDTLRLFRMEATDTYVRTGERVLIAPADFTLSLDKATCLATNPRPVPFTVKGGTGRYSGATGGGTFDLAMNHPPCNGLVHPVHVWFKGQLERAAS